MLNKLKKPITRFFRREEGDASIEAVIVLPILLWIFGAIWVWHDVSRQRSLEQKVNYTIGDMISRETDPLDDDYIDNTYKLVQSMLDSSSSKTDMRITVVRQTKNVNSNASNSKYEVVWSEARGNRPPMSGNLNSMKDALPVMARNDQVVLVQTWTDYSPAMEAGLDAFEIQSYSFTRPRFAPQILFDDDGSNSNANNGWGNGDQSAPGGSLCNNNAENYDDGQAADECADNSDGEENIEPKKGKGKGKA